MLIHLHSQASTAPVSAIGPRPMARGREFTDRLFGLRKRAATGAHEFDQLCADLGIEHRPAPPRHPQTNGIPLGDCRQSLPGNGSSGSMAASRRCCNRTISGRVKTTSSFRNQPCAAERRCKH